MHLTRYTDYAMRVLVHLGVESDRLVSIAEIARAYGISQNHLMKVVHDLGKAGYLTSVRGRGGGIRLALPPEDINIGAIVRHTEEGFTLVDCDHCIIGPACGLTGIVNEALAAFLGVLDRYTLADLLWRPSALARLLSPGSSVATAAPPLR